MAERGARSPAPVVTTSPVSEHLARASRLPPASMKSSRKANPTAREWDKTPNPTRVSTRPCSQDVVTPECEPGEFASDVQS